MPKQTKKEITPKPLAVRKLKPGRYTFSVFSGGFQKGVVWMQGAVINPRSKTPVRLWVCVR